jgi:glucan 1,3-beta-glucosidase
MYLTGAAVFSAFVLGALSEHLKVPSVDAIVEKTLESVDNYVHFEGANSEASTVSKRQGASYWYENISHQGISAFGPGGYTVYRNVKSYGAKGALLLLASAKRASRNSNYNYYAGDGVTDDTAAINAAISDGARCGKGCGSSTTTPAVVYFPAGTYLISSSIIDLYYTQLIGNPNDVPVLKATSGFSGFGLIDGDPYFTQDLNWGSTTVFYREVRNFILDMRSIPASAAATGIHWPTAQATSLRNIVFQMSAATGTQHVGLFCESGMSVYSVFSSLRAISSHEPKILRLLSRQHPACPASAIALYEFFTDAII